MNAARRPRGALRVAIVDAARDVFVEQGYDGASISRIADAASTTKAAVYRHFDDKPALFEAAVVEPFEAVLRVFMNRWNERPVAELATAELFDAFNTSVLGFVAEHRADVVTLLAAEQHNAEELRGIRRTFSELIGEVVALVAADARERGWEHFDVEIATRSTIAMVIGTALLDPWLYGPTQRRPARARVASELTRYQLNATTERTRPR